MGEQTDILLKKPAPTYYGIVFFKIVKGTLFLSAAIAAYTLSDNNLPEELQRLFQWLHLDPDSQFFKDFATQLGQVTQTQALWVAAGTLAYSLFSLVEGIGMMFRVGWAGWLAIGESAFFIPIEIFELSRRFSTIVACILLINIIIVWYLFQNRHRLFRHHHAAPPEPEPDSP